MANKTKISGVFYKNLPKGVCFEENCDGSTYHGEFLNGKKEGQGKLIKKDGAIYEGEFLNDLPHGQGTEKLPDSSIIQANYIEGKKFGKAQIVKTDSIIECSYKDDLLEGTGIIKSNNGLETLCN